MPKVVQSEIEEILRSWFGNDKIIATEDPFPGVNHSGAAISNEMISDNPFFIAITYSTQAERHKLRKQNEQADRLIQLRDQTKALKKSLSREKYDAMKKAPNRVHYLQQEMKECAAKISEIDKKLEAKKVKADDETSAQWAKSVVGLQNEREGWVNQYNSFNNIQQFYTTTKEPNNIILCSTPTGQRIISKQWDKEAVDAMIKTSETMGWKQVQILDKDIPGAITDPELRLYALNEYAKKGITVVNQEAVLASALHSKLESVPEGYSSFKTVSDDAIKQVSEINRPITPLEQEKSKQEKAKQEAAKTAPPKETPQSETPRNR